LEKNLGSISDMARLPAALFVVDVMKEHIAVAEARKLKIPTFAIVDTNSDPNLVDFAIPANDDASKSISLIVKAMCDAIQEGLNEQVLDKDKRLEEDIEEAEERDMKKFEEDDDNKPIRGSDGRRKRIGENAGDDRQRRGFKRR